MMSIFSYNSQQESEEAYIYIPLMWWKEFSEVSLKDVLLESMISNITFTI